VRVIVAALIAALLLDCGSAACSRAQTVTVGFASVHTAPEQLNGATGVECSIQLGPRGAPFAFVVNYRYVQQTIEPIAMTCDRYWPSYTDCVTEIVHQESFMSTLMGGILFEPQLKQRTSFGVGVGLQASRVVASGFGETTGRQFEIYSQDMLSSFVLMGHFSVQPTSWPLDLIATFRVEGTSFGESATDASWQLEPATGVLGWSVGARYRFRT
jgi:hypothetical protein